MKSQLLSVVFIDVQGYTRRTATQSRRDNQKFLHETREFVTRHIDEHGGQLVKTMGDGFMASFSSPSNAVQCGLEMQKNLKSRNANVKDPNNLVRFRIGINTGEVDMDEHGDLFGDTVNIAARIEGFAEPNEVFISEATYLAMNRSEFGALDLGPQSFKNATREIRVYKIASSIPAGQIIRKKAANTAKYDNTSSWFNNPWIIGSAVALTTLIVLSSVLRLTGRGGNGDIPPRPATDVQQRPDTARTGGDIPPRPDIMRPGTDIQQRPDIIRPGQEKLQLPDITRFSPEDLQQWDISRILDKDLSYFPAISEMLRKAPQKYRDNVAHIEALKGQNRFMEALEATDNMVGLLEKENHMLRPGLFLELGFLFLRAGNESKGNSYFRRALEIAPDNPVAVRNIRRSISELRRSVNQ